MLRRIRSILVAGVIVMSVAASAAPPARAAAHLAPNQGPLALFQIRPTSGPVGTVVGIKGAGFGNFGCGPQVLLSFTDASGVATYFGWYSPTFKARVTIPDGASIGAGEIVASQRYFGHDGCLINLVQVASVTFTVTS
jgi:hypothetical protein